MTARRADTGTTTHENGDQTVSDERDLKSHQIMELSRELERMRAEKAEAALERVTALADELDAQASRFTQRGLAIGNTTDSDLRRQQVRLAGIAAGSLDAAQRIRRSVRGDS